MDISGYTSSFKYKIPEDGYIRVCSEQSTSGYIRMVICDSAETTVGWVYLNITNAYQAQSIYVRKDFYTYVLGNTASVSTIIYRPLLSK